MYRLVIKTRKGLQIGLESYTKEMAEAKALKMNSLKRNIKVKVMSEKELFN